MIKKPQNLLKFKTFKLSGHINLYVQKIFAIERKNFFNIYGFRT